MNALAVVACVLAGVLVFLVWCGYRIVRIYIRESIDFVKQLEGE